ncbi:unnamed protein product [Arabidopsis halleri]
MGAPLREWKTLQVLIQIWKFGNTSERVFFKTLQV